MTTKLLFVYNADSGLFNTLADIGHKVFSPETYNCQLCALTYGYLSERKEWRAFIESLPISCDFLHRDEFRQRYPDNKDPLPAVFLLEDDQPRICLDSDRLIACDSLDALQASLLQHCLHGNPA